MKVNLEKALLKQKKTLIVPKELLYIREYDRLQNIPSALERIGVASTLKLGKNIKNSLNKNENEAARFDPARVFHVSQIERLCKNYGLRFLSSWRFEGSVDEQLARKISAFESQYGVQMYSSNDHAIFTRFDTDGEKNNSFIAAPAESFNLQKRPVDPLLFYRINGDFYYLVHKWGKDINMMRMLANKYFLISILFLAAALCSLCGAAKVISLYGGDNAHGWIEALLVLLTIGLFILTGASFFATQSERRRWNSSIKD